MAGLLKVTNTGEIILWDLAASAGTLITVELLQKVAHVPLHMNSVLAQLIIRLVQVPVQVYTQIRTTNASYMLQNYF